MTPLEKVEIVKKIVTIFEEVKLTGADKHNVLMSILQVLYSSDDDWYISAIPVKK